MGRLLRRYGSPPASEGATLKPFGSLASNYRLIYELHLHLLIPCLTVAILLFYVFDNPPVGIVGTAYRHNGKTEVKRDGRTLVCNRF